MHSILHVGPTASSPVASISGVVLETNTQGVHLTAPGLFLDPATLDAHFASLGERIGVIPAHKGSRFSLMATRRLCRLLAQRHAGSTGLPPDVVAAAWFFPIWTELCTLIPARHLARRLVRLAKGSLIMIPLSVKPAYYLGYWRRNGLEPLFLTAAINKAGGRAVLVFQDFDSAEATCADDKVVLRFDAHKEWNSTEAPESVEEHNKVAVVPAGIRGLDRIIGSLGRPLAIRCDFSEEMPGVSAEAILTPEAALPTIELTFLRGEALKALPGVKHVFNCEIGMDLGLCLANVLTKSTRIAGATAARLARNHSLQEVHICDVLFFESTLMAHAVAARGGRVIVWPHSSNAVHVDERPASLVHEVVALTSSAAAKWRAGFPGLPITVKSALMLRPAAGPRFLTPGTPITLVLYAGAHSMNRMPLLNEPLHAQGYRRLFAGVASMGPSVRLLCKAKGEWETMEWLRSLAGPAFALEETRESSIAIEQPNMIFISVSYGSTALLEGLGRGIPCMVVRECPVEDYTAIDAAHMPVAGASLVLDAIRRCQDHAVFDAMTRRQLEWYETETYFGDIRKSTTA